MQDENSTKFKAEETSVKIIANFFHLIEYKLCFTRTKNSHFWPDVVYIFRT